MGEEETLSDEGERVRYWSCFVLGGGDKAGLLAHSFHVDSTKSRVLLVQGLSCTVGRIDLEDLWVAVPEKKRDNYYQK